MNWGFIYAERAHVIILCTYDYIVHMKNKRRVLVLIELSGWGMKDVFLRR